MSLGTVVTLLFVVITFFLIFILVNALGRKIGHYDGDKGDQSNSPYWKSTKMRVVKNTQTAVMKRFSKDTTNSLWKKSLADGIIIDDDGKRRALLDIFKSIRAEYPIFSFHEDIEDIVHLYKTAFICFSEGNIDLLEYNISPSVYYALASAVKKRKARKETLIRTIVAIESNVVQDVSFKENKEKETAIVTMHVLFCTDITSYTKNDDGIVIEGDPVTVKNMKDLWTFSKDFSQKSKTNEWRIIET